MSDEWLVNSEKLQPIVKIPLKFYFEPVQILSKQLTKLNSSSPFRIHYLGPRWQDSSVLHKKYANKQGYKFNDKQVNKSSNFFSQTMCQNQFYRNQVYYRAFEGMNPTIDKQQQYQFNSRFQSGNLDCVVKVAPDQYDLFLRIDSNTRGHLFWFYFQVSNCKPNSIIKLNICNMTKSIELYQKGFKPFVSVKNQNGQFKNWSQQPCTQVVVGQKKLRYDFIYEKTKVRKLLQLSFKYKFQSTQPVRFAYCIPYTYSEMLTDLQKITIRNPQCKIGSLTRSLTGVNIPFLIVGKDTQVKSSNQKLIFICISRLHPGQTNGLHVLNEFMNYVCTSNQAEYIRKKFITIFIPMLNPDGVILGNSRAGATGKDLNRQFKTRNLFLYPEICNLKKLCYTISETHQIQMFLDFHGHSRKKNMFLFGPNYNITQPEYYKCRVFPKFLSQITPTFRYFGCDYSIPASKMTTARAIMLHQLGIPNVYAIQTSVGQYFDYQSHKVNAMGLKKWLELGTDVGKAMKQYIQSIQQFNDYCKSKASNLNVFNEPEISPPKINSNSKNSKIPPLKSPSSPDKIPPKKLPIFKDKQIKLLKVFEQIKSAQQQRKTVKKKGQQSENSSDSQNEQDNLESKKRIQFEQMVVQFIQTQKKRQQNQIQFQGKKLSASKKQHLFRLPRRSKQKSFKRQQLNMMKQIMKNSWNNSNLSQTQKDVQDLSSLSTNKIKNNYSYRSQECSNCHKNKQPQVLFNNRSSRQAYQSIITQHIFFDDVLPENSTKDKQRKNNSLNLRMFNFSKMIEQTDERNAATSVKKGKVRYISKMKDINTLDESYQSEDNKNITNLFNKTINRLSINEQKPKQNQYKQQIIIDTERQKQTVGYGSSRRVKGLYPASFYRIKYQNYQKKKQKNSNDQKQQVTLSEYEDIKNIQMHRKKQGLFLNIRKVDNI